MFAVPGTKVPLPDDDQIAPVEMAKDPLRLTDCEFLQMILSVPALTLGAVEIVTVICFNTAAQPPFPVEVKVRVTVPAAMSAKEGT